MASRLADGLQKDIQKINIAIGEVEEGVAEPFRSLLTRYRTDAKSLRNEYMPRSADT